MLQSDILIAYAAKWKLYHLSLRILLVCFDKLNKNLSARPTTTKARPPSSTAVKPGSRYVNTPSTTPGDASEVEKAALSLWRSILFEPFQERLLAVALAKITEDRDASFYQTSTEDLASASRLNPSSSISASSSASDPVKIGSKTKEGAADENIWVPMGGDTLVAQLVENILRLGDVGPTKLKLYEESFERLYLLQVGDYFGRESASYISSQGITAFISLALLRLNQESQRTSRYLHPCSKAKVTAALHKVLIIRHKDAMLSEFTQMLRAERKDQMHALYSLLIRLENGCEELKAALAEYIVETSTHALRSLLDAQTSETVSSAAPPPSRASSAIKRKKNDRGSAQNVSPQAYVDTLTQLHVKFSALVQNSFNEDSAFMTTLDRAYKEVVNSTILCEDYTLGPELMARQSDALLRKGTVALSESDLDTKINQLVNVFKYADDKDIFQNFYSKLLAKRLINASSVSDDTERAMMTVLKPVCSSEFILRVQKMFTDIQLSKEASEKFQTFVEALPTSAPSPAPTSQKEKDGEANGADSLATIVSTRPSTNLDFSVFVLTTGSWPLQEQQGAFNMPEAIVEYLKAFSAFYASLHTGRKLNWLYNLHRGEIRYMARKKYDISASAFQVGALLAFDSETTSVLSVDQLTVMLGLPIGETTSLVKNLLDCKLLMVAAPDSDSLVASSSNERAEEESKGVGAKKGGSISGSTQCQLNPSFANKKIKFKLPAPAPSDAAKSAAQTAAKEEIDGDRTQFLQAVIVRTMKTRKTLTHTQLVQEVIDQCKSRFRANVALIKRQIDALIEMEYLMRAKDKADVYNYCA